jgi:hypothetical protein
VRKWLLALIIQAIISVSAPMAIPDSGIPKADKFRVAKVGHFALLFPN